MYLKGRRAGNKVSPLRWGIGLCAVALLLLVWGPRDLKRSDLPPPRGYASFVAALPGDGTPLRSSLVRRLVLNPRNRGKARVELNSAIDGFELDAISGLADSPDIRGGTDEGWFGRALNGPVVREIPAPGEANPGEASNQGAGYGDLAALSLDFELLHQELSALERDYEGAAENLFADLSFRLISPAGNPFDQVLGQALPLTSDESHPDMEPVSEGSNEPVDESLDGPLPGPTAPEGMDGISAESSPTTEITDPESEDPDFGFLVIGAFGEDRSRAGVFRAYRDEVGGFVLENDFNINLPPVITDNNLIFEKSDRIITADLDGNGVLDVVRGRIGKLGTKLESYLGLPAGGFERQAQGFVFHQAVLSMALFDLDADGELELVLVTNGGSRLIVYERTADVFQYRKELLLPFEPGMVLASETNFGQQQLLVWNRTLDRTLVLSQGLGNFLTQALMTPSSRSLLLDSLGSEADAEVIVVEDGQRLTLLSQSEEGPVLLASLVRDPKVPFLIVGDYQGFESRQMAFWF